MEEESHEAGLGRLRIARAISSIVRFFRMTNHVAHSERERDIVAGAEFSPEEREIVRVMTLGAILGSAVDAAMEEPSDDEEEDEEESDDDEMAEPSLMPPYSPVDYISDVSTPEVGSPANSVESTHSRHWYS
jgi:hypothetical protein